MRKPPRRPRFLSPLFLTTALPLGLLACATSSPEVEPLRELGQPFWRDEGDWATTVPARGLSARMEGGIAVLSHGEDELQILTARIGRDEANNISFDRPTPGPCLDDRQTPRGDCLRPLDARAGTVLERWISRPDGLQQGWFLEQEPEGTGPLAVELDLLGAEAQVTTDRITLTFAPDRSIQIGELQAWDARGRELPAWFEATSSGFAVRVDDLEATYPVTIDPLYTTPAWSLEEDVQLLEFGASAAGADLDGDGLEEVIVGASGALDGEGRVYVYVHASGRFGSATLEIDGLGWVVGAPGDFDGDGDIDLPIGDPEEADGQGQITLCEGSAGGPGDDCTLTLDGEAAGDAFGQLMVSADVNGDAYDDLVVGAPGALDGAGSLYVFHGSASGLSSSPDLQIDGGAADDALGTSLDRAGDVDADGYDDLIVGAPGADVAYVFVGSAAGLDRAGTTLSGAAGSRFGASVAGARDLNRDGYDDVVVGAPALESAYTFHGSASGLSTTAAATLVPPSSGSSSWEGFGKSMGSGTDYDGDGYDDIVGHEDSSVSTSDRVLLYRGSSTGITSTTPRGETLNAVVTPVIGAVDVNGDGSDDMLFSSTSTLSAGGAAIVFTRYSARSGFSRMEIASPSPDSMGYGGQAAALGDVNGDGYADILVELDEGWGLFYGSASGPATEPDLSFSFASGTLFKSSLPINGGCDLNGDGYDDLVVSTEEDDAYTLEIHLGSADGLTEAASIERTLDTRWKGRCVDDMDDDGLDDVVLLGDCDTTVFDVPDTADDDTGGSGTTCLRLLPGDADGVADDPDDPVSITTWDLALRHLSSAGDVNGDGIGDLAMSAVNNNAEYSSVWVLHGSTDGMESSPSFTFGATEANWGSELSRGGDLNADGYGDLLVACTYYGSGSPSMIRIFYGSADGLSTSDYSHLNYDEWDDDTLSGDPLVTTLGDLDGDGYDDVVFGGLEDRWESSKGGGVFSSYGSADGVSDELGDGFFPFDDPTASQAIDSMVAAGDVNGDGYADLLTCSDSRSATLPNGHYDLFYGYHDVDGDGIPASEDCDDTDPLAEESTFYLDADGDGYGDAAAAAGACDLPEGYSASDADCDDADAAYHPGATESCDDPADYDCDGITTYADADADGWAECVECDDADGDVHPDADETCDGVDQDCDGETDEDAADALSWYRDVDGDGYGDDADLTLSCTTPDGYVALSGDCDDADAAYHPGAAESCEEPTDYDCDGITTYADADADGWPACTECDDTVWNIHPGGVETCDGVDQDCVGEIDEDATDASTWHPDSDGDGYGDSEVETSACAAPEGYIADGSDCDDASASVHPGAVELPDDGLDQDCDGEDASAAHTGETGDTGSPAETGDTGSPDSPSGDDSAPTTPPDTGCAASGEKADGGCSVAGGRADAAALLLALALIRRRSPRGRALETKREASERQY